MDIRITGTANLQQMQSQFKAMQMQVVKLNEELAATSIIPGRVNPAGYQQFQRQVAKSSEIWRAAAASTGVFTTQQLKLNTATEQYTELLKRQKLSLADLRRNRTVLKRAYEDQIRMQNMIVRENPVLSAGGKTSYDVAIPTNISKELDTIGNKLGWIGAQTASASRQMINWGKNTQWAGRQLMVGFTMPVAAFGAATGVLAYQVDKQLTRIQKVYDTTNQVVVGDSNSMAKVNAELARVSAAAGETATKAANEYGASANDTLSVQAELAATGLKGASLQKATTEAMRLATLGELDYNQAAETTIALQTAFRLNTQQLTDAFNFMNATENATSLSIQDIAEATPRAASAMSALGVTVEQMTVMLASMKESGVDAAEAANALKSATGTMLAPSPSAQKFIDQLTNGRIQITEIAKEANGNLYDALQGLSQAMDGLSKFEKQQILVKLFGKYQFNRVSAMLYNMEDAFNGVQNQTHRAMELMGQDTQQLADIAEQEMGRFQESASGKFMRAWQSARIELAKIGEPFLNVATKVLSYVEKLAKAFNALPDKAKTISAIGAILMALVGPTIMMIGLASNFAGNLGLVIARIINLGSDLKILNKSEWATQKIAEATSNGFDRQATAVENLTAQINVLVQAATEARQAVGAMAQTRVQPGDIVGLGMPTMGQGGRTVESRNIVPLGLPVGLTDKNSPYARGARKSDLELQAKTARDRMHSALATSIAERETAAAAQASAAATAAEVAKRERLNTLSEKTEGFLSGGRLATAAMLTSTAAMVQPWSDSVHHAGQMLFLVSAIVPAVGIVGTMAKSVAARMTGIYTAAKKATAAEIAGATGATKWARSSNVLKAVLSGAGSALTGAVGATGLWTAGLTAAGFVAYKVYKNSQDHIKEINDEQKALNNSVNTWADTLGVVAKNYEKIHVPNTGDIGKTPIDELVSRFKDQPGSKDMISAYNNADSATVKDTVALQQYIKLLQQTNANASQARKGLQAFFMAAGDGAVEAEIKVEHFYATIGNKVNLKDMSTLWNKQFADLANFGGSGDWIETAKTRGAEIGKVLADAIARQKAPTDKIAVLEQFKAAANQETDKFWEQFSKGPLTKSGAMTFAGFFKALDITSSKEFEKFRADFQEFVDRAISPEEFEKRWNGLDLKNTDMYRVIQNLESIKFTDNQAGTEALRASLKVLKDQLHIKEDISTVDQLQNTYEWQLYTVTKKTAPHVLAMAEAQVEAANAQAVADGATSMAAGEMKLAALNTVRVAMGLKAVDNLIWGFTDNTHKAAKDTEEIKNNLNSTPKHLSIQVDFNSEDWTKMMQSGMEGVQSTMASDAENILQAQADAAQKAAQNRADALEKALDRRQENAMDAFENRWEKRKDAVKKAYDERIKKVDEEIKAEQKADDIRQKIFQNEMDRINRLNEAANKNIDFNVALNSGNFDEAAKIRNDMQATSDTNALQDALNAQSERTTARVDHLNNRKDTLEKQQDRVLNALDKREEAQRKHLERMQENQRDALKEQTEANLEALKQQQEDEKKNLDNRLDLFKAYTARNQKDLERWMKVVGLSYDDFGIDVKHKGDEWSNYFRESLSSNIHQAGAKIMSDKIWQKMGKNVAKDLLGGALDMSPAQFKHWMLTGEFTTGGYQSRSEKNSHVNDVATGGGRFHDPQPVIRHTGGLINSSMGSRKGVARNAGMHPSERLVLAQNDEFMVNRQATRDNLPLLNAINSGHINMSRTNVGNGVGGERPLGIAGAMAGIIAAAMKATITRGMNQGIASRQAELAGTTYGPMSGVFGAGKAGLYSDRAFSAAQLNNAAIIANVGNQMGMSARDIMIGIMTAITESSLINVNGGDRDSLGLFQQRPSMGWGTPEQVTDPEYAARKFFSVLKGIAGRQGMDPWMAAQAVQRSAYSDGSNYRQYWDNARAIFQSGLTKAKVGGGYAVTQPGKGGWAKPSVPGKGWSNSHDYRNGPGSPLYAYNDGVVVDSRAITSGGSAGNGVFVAPNGMPYRSFGETIAIRGNDGNIVRYAHLSPGKRYVRAGEHVSGGQLVGLSGWTGNATGPHTHFEINGLEVAREWFANHGIGLKTGGFLSRQGISNLHNAEAVVDSGRTAKLWESMDAFNFTMGQFSKLRGANVAVPQTTNVARSGDINYNAEVNLYGSDLDVDDVTTAVIKALKQIKDRKPGSRKS